MGKLFDLDSPIMRVLNRVADLMILNLINSDIDSDKDDDIKNNKHKNESTKNNSNKKNNKNINNKKKVE